MRGGERMDSKTRETLENQLQILSECSENAIDCHELAVLTEAMIQLAEALRWKID